MVAEIYRHTSNHKCQCVLDLLQFVKLASDIPESTELQWSSLEQTMVQAIIFAVSVDIDGRIWCDNGRGLGYERNHPYSLKYIAISDQLRVLLPCLTMTTCVHLYYGYPFV